MPNHLRKIAESYYQQTCSDVEKIPQSGSARAYHRFYFENKPSLIGVINADVKENEAFFSFTDTFLKQQIHVPEILFIDPSRKYYLLQDLGNETLFSYLNQHRKSNQLSEKTLTYYKKVLQQLPLLQLSGQNGIDFSVCYPRDAFDQQSMLWDLNYFKYYFLKLAHIPFDEQLLENDFQTFIQFLSQADSHYFMFRDFQSRNIMLFEDKPYFIDYQGGRKGALQYDLASLLYDGKANLPQEVRDQLYDYYLDQLAQYITIDREQFTQYFKGFVLIRIMQAMGAYGYRGYYEKKTLFLQSIPYAVKNIVSLLQDLNLPIEIPTLLSVLDTITKTDFDILSTFPEDQLTISIRSFSYKKGIPEDPSGNGGGFVFDCRALPNPGRFAEYKTLTGRDPEVIHYLNQYDEVSIFNDHVFQIVELSIENYLERKFNHLMVNFGCTGGQHRSVYFADSLAQHIRNQYPQVHVILKHTQFPEL
ncbi:MAG TPA: RNase adapter RapZ [Bacteroidales bacterium]|nr:RNase adapter RapZ [Bacteroidales bacterium]